MTELHPAAHAVDNTASATKPMEFANNQEKATHEAYQAALKLLDDGKDLKIPSGGGPFQALKLHDLHISNEAASALAGMINKETGKHSYNAGDSLRDPLQHALFNNAHVSTPDTMCHDDYQKASPDDKARADGGTATEKVLTSWIKPDGKDNPPPSTWKYDDKGHLIQAGDKFHATYDKQGNLVDATLDGDHWQKTGPNQVTETSMGNDGKPLKYVNNNVTKFEAKPWMKDWDGKVAGVAMEAGGSYLGADVYEEPAHQAAWKSLMNAESVCNSLKNN
jgi:hypothetical protein